VENPLIFDMVELKAAILKGKNPQLLDKLDQYLDKIQKDPSSNYHQLQNQWLSTNLGTKLFHLHISEIKREIEQWSPIILAVGSILLAILILAVYSLTKIKFKRNFLKLPMKKIVFNSNENKYRNLVENVPYGF
jgi:hypothetical protein